MNFAWYIYTYYFVENKNSFWFCENKMGSEAVEKAIRAEINHLFVDGVERVVH